MRSQALSDRGWSLRRHVCPIQLIAARLLEVGLPVKVAYSRKCDSTILE